MLSIKSCVGKGAKQLSVDGLIISLPLTFSQPLIKESILGSAKQPSITNFRIITKN